MAERASLVLAAVAVVAGGIFWGPIGSLAALAGGVIAWADFWLLRRVVRRLVGLIAGASEGVARGPLAGLIVLKLGGLLGVLWVALRVVELPLLPFALGLSVLPAAALAMGMRFTNPERGA